MKSNVYNENVTVWSSKVNHDEYITELGAKHSEKRMDIDKIKAELLKNRGDKFVGLVKVSLVKDYD